MASCAVTYCGTGIATCSRLMLYLANSGPRVGPAGPVLAPKWSGEPNFGETRGQCAVGAWLASRVFQKAHLIPKWPWIVAGGQGTRVLVAPIRVTSLGKCQWQDAQGSSRGPASAGSSECNLKCLEESRPTDKLVSTSVSGKATSRPTPGP